MRKILQNLNFRKKLDQPMLLLTIVLITIGLIMVFSASYAVSLSESGNAYHFVVRQSLFAFGGFFLMLGISGFDYHSYHKIAPFAYGGSIILMLLVAVMGLSEGGATRWLDIGGISFQPSEIAKISVIMLLASQITKKQKVMHKFKEGIVENVAIVLGVGIFTAGLQSHLSATAIITLTALFMMFVGGADFKKIFLIAIPLGALAVAYIVTNDYTMSRIKMWFNPFIDLQNGGWQGAQSHIAIGSGGLFGLGFGQSRQKHMFLPEPHNDFIFSVICEELGFIGALVIIILFAMFIVRGYAIASKSKDKFGMLLGVGIVTKFAIQVMMNLFVVTGIMPITGVSLPFFSYGGTALIIQMCEIGILLNISRQNK